MTRQKDTWRSSRGAQAYREAYRYIADGNPDLPAGQQRRLALRYLRITASPPLSWRGTLSAWRAAREQGQEKNA
jgi:hypothetical protein